MSGKKKIKKNKKLNFNGVSTWVARGKYYGYPNCCIDEFISFCLTGSPKRDKPRKFSGTGYVPCEYCEKHVPKQTLISMINVNRVHHVSFDDIVKQTAASNHRFATLKKIAA